MSQEPLKLLGTHPRPGIYEGAAKELAAKLGSADAFIVATPEYNHSWGDSFLRCCLRRPSSLRADPASACRIENSYHPQWHRDQRGSALKTARKSIAYPA